MEYALVDTSPATYLDQREEGGVVVSQLWNDIQDSATVVEWLGHYENDGNVLSDIWKIFDAGVLAGMRRIVVDSWNELQGDKMMKTCDVSVMDCVLEWSDDRIRRCKNRVLREGDAERGAQSEEHERPGVAPVQNKNRDFHVVMTIMETVKELIEYIMSMQKVEMHQKKTRLYGSYVRKKMQERGRVGSSGEDPMHGQSVDQQINGADKHTSYQQEILGMSNRMIERLNEMQDEAERILEYSKLMWIVVELDGGCIDPHSGQTWRDRVADRRQAAQDGQLIVDTLIFEMQKESKNAVLQYPPDTLKELLRAMCMDASVSSDRGMPISSLETTPVSRLTTHQHYRLAIFVYSVLDRGLIQNEEKLVPLLRNMFGVDPQLCRLWILQFYLDQSFVTRATPADNFIAHLNTLDANLLPLYIFEVLLAQEQYTLALSLFRQRSQMEKCIDISEVCMGMKIRLYNGAFVEAFIEMKRYLHTLPAALRGKRTQTVYQNLISWCSAVNRIQHVITLPISTREEEDAILSWLEDVYVETHEAHYMKLCVMYFVLRGRTTEAIQYYTRIQDDDVYLRDVIEVAAKISRAYGVDSSTGKNTRERLSLLGSAAETGQHGSSKAHDDQTTSNTMISSAPLFGSSYIGKEHHMDVDTSAGTERGFSAFTTAVKDADMEERIPSHHTRGPRKSQAHALDILLSS